MKALTKYSKNRKAAINSLLEKPKRKYTSGTFHKLRVEIKKLNALFELLKFCSKDFKQKNTFKPFKLIFRQAGKIRELQIQEEMLNKYLLDSSLNDYIASLKKLRLKEQKMFFSIVNKKHAVGLNNKFHEVASLLSAVSDQKVAGYLEKKKDFIIQLISQNILEMKQVHELRKQLKIFNYNRESLSLEKSNKRLSKQDVLPVLLGEWHDLQVIIRDLKKAIDARQISQKEILQLERIQEEISSCSDTLFSKINIARLESDFFDANNQRTNV